MHSRQLLTTHILATALLLCSLGSPLLAKHQVKEDTAPQLTAFEMTQRAERFLKEIAAYSSVHNPADPIASQAWPRPPKSHIQPQAKKSPAVTVTGYQDTGYRLYNYLWHVRYRDAEVEVTIDPTNGKVARFRDNGLDSRLEADPPTDKSACISEATAISRTAHYLRLAGFDTNQFFVRHIELLDIHAPTQANDRIWFVVLRRIYQGVSFDTNQDAIVQLEAGEGRLLMMTSSAPITLPTSPRVDLSPKEATHVTSSFLKQRGYTLIQQTQTNLQFVLPNRYWTDGNTKPATSQSHLAWVCSFVLYAQNTPLKGSVWVDASTGEVVGGDEISGEKGPSSDRVNDNNSLKKTLTSAVSLHLKSIDASGSAKIQELTLKLERLRFYGVLSGFEMPTPGQIKLPFVPTYQIDVEGPHGEKQMLGYDSHSGMIGSLQGDTNERLAMGPGFRQWAGSLFTDRPQP